MTAHIVIRADASYPMGTGHLRRCMSLASALDQLGCKVSLVCRKLDAVAPQLLDGCRWNIIWLERPRAVSANDGDYSPAHASWAGVPWSQDAAETVDSLSGERPAWVVVDHYAFDARWHERLRTALDCQVLAIDDLADRPMAADALLDQNLCADHSGKYAPVLKREPQWLLGPRYALLSPAYRHAKRYAMSEQVHSIGIFMGGTDPGGVTSRILSICRQDGGFTGIVEVVSSVASPHIAALRKACAASPRTKLTLDEPDLAAFFSRHDLQIGAGGGATWERCCIGAPSIAIPMAANQVDVVSALAAAGAARAASVPLDTAATSGCPAPLPELADVLRALLASIRARQDLCENTATLVDGLGAHRVAISLLRDTLRLRPATVGDMALLHGWRNHPSVRDVSASAEPISLSDHASWLHRTLGAVDRALFVAMVGQTPVGCIRFDGEHAIFTVSLYLDPELTGLGLGSRMLNTGEHAMQQRHGNLTIEATVVPDNMISQHLFSNAGYSGGPLRYCKRVIDSAH